jgi:hypothetical protein
VSRKEGPRLRRQCPSQNLAWHRINVFHTGNLGRPRPGGPKFKAAANFPNRAPQASAEQISQSGVFDRDNNLPSAPADGCKDFHEIQSAIVVDVLDWIVE